MEELPRFLNKSEAHHTTKIKKWCEKNLEKSALIEIKHTKTDKLYFTTFKPHQIPTLQKAKHGSVIHKPSDALRQRQIGDLMFFCGADAWVFIIFKDEIYKFDIDTIKNIQDTGVKYITKQYGDKIS
jgi:hypothetical protein